MPARISETNNGKAGNHLGIEPISMRVSDACRYTGISRSTLYLLIAKGEVEIIKLGASTLVITESLRRYVDSKRCRLSGKRVEWDGGVVLISSGKSGQDSAFRA